jgi:hypothetical protein
MRRVVHRPMDVPHEDRRRESWSYAGEVWTDGAGRAVVVLPPFVRVHRDGFDYELTRSALALRNEAVSF